jgi:hypothetical protein
VIPLAWSTPKYGWRFEAGQVFWSTLSHYDDGKVCSAGWTNCDNRHLWVVTPGLHPFDLMGRAGNCGSPDDTEHRCWIVHITGDDLTTLTVDKAGLTCSAGAGSLLVHPAPDGSGGWHGFVRGGQLVEC